MPGRFAEVFIVGSGANRQPAGGSDFVLGKALAAGHLDLDELVGGGRHSRSGAAGGLSLSRGGGAEQAEADSSRAELNEQKARGELLERCLHLPI